MAERQGAGPWLERVLLEKNGGPLRETDFESPATARFLWANFRGQMGENPNPTNLLTWPSAQPKTGKNTIPTYVLHLSPANGSERWNVCPWSTPGCRDACLNTAGRGKFDGVQRGRQLRTLFLGASPQGFMGRLVHEIDLAVKRHAPDQVAIRLNGTSDIRWERLAPYLFERWGDSVIFYDYTKSPNRKVPDNYHLTYSVNEYDSVANIADKLDRYGRAAIVLDTKRGEDLPSDWHDLPVVDGDKDDQRWQNCGVLVGLRAKGDAIGDTSGFVRVANPTKKEIAA